MPADNASSATVEWTDPDRRQHFNRWLDSLSTSHQLLPASLRPASADASFRRYLRVDT
ncbi:MAG: aminoglycoside phosphotransferase, partial [Hydrogenophaga sp.]|nr:aminoglycoside phosphotransferase [Hydrogenophaga sp.]